MVRIKKLLRDDFWIVLLDIIAVNASYYLALVLRGLMDGVSYRYGEYYRVFSSVFYRFAPWYTAICLVVFFSFKLYGGLWRYAGIRDMNRVIGASVVTTFFQIVGTLILVQPTRFAHFPFAYYGIGAALQFFSVAAIRFSYRVFVLEKRRSEKKAGTAMIVGAGDMGRTTFRLLDDGVAFDVACVIDTEHEYEGKFMDGIPIYGIDRFEDELVRHDVNCVFLAEPDLKKTDREQIKKICDARKVELRDYTLLFAFPEETESNVIVKASEGKRMIPFSPPDISESEIGEVVETLKSGWITTGPRTKLLERRLAAYIETGKVDVDTESDPERWKDRVVCLSSATAAEELNMRVFGIRPGDEVIVPAYTYTATASAAIHCGATVKFVDIQKDGDKRTHMPEMDYDQLERVITERTKAIIVVDLGGIVADYKRVFEIVERKRHLFKALENDGTPLGDLNSRIQKSIGRIAVFADCAHSLGASRVIDGQKQYCGAIADFTSFSFHAVKNFTTAEGGASTWKPIQGVENAEIYRFYQLLSLHGQNKDALAKTKQSAWEYDIIGPWYKCNMTDIMAAIGLRQLDRYTDLLARREEIVKKYDKVCDELGLFHLYHQTPDMSSSNHLYFIRIPGINTSQRNSIIEKMAEHGVATNVHYKPLPIMTAYGKDCSAFPYSFDYYHNLITLPLHTLLSDEDIEYICVILKKVVSEL